MLQSELLENVRKANFNPSIISKWAKDLIQGIAIYNLKERNNLGQIGSELLQLAGFSPSSLNEAHGPRVQDTISSSKSTKGLAQTYLVGSSKDKDSSSPNNDVVSKESIEDNQFGAPSPLFDHLDSSSFDSPKVNFNLGRYETHNSRSHGIGPRSWKRVARRTKCLQQAVLAKTGESFNCGFSKGRGGGPIQAPPTSLRFLSWNCRGLGNVDTVIALKNLIKKNKPDYVFLMVIKRGSKKLSRIYKKLSFGNSLIVDAIGSVGGLILFWNDNISATCLLKSEHLICSFLKDTNSVLEWLFISCYRTPYLGEK